jgi:heptosyltransferase-3
MRVLIIFPGALGDLICLGPAIRAICRRHPDDSIELMARAELARFAVGRMGIAKDHSIDRREIGALFRREIDVDATTRAFFSHFSHIYSFFAFDDSDFRRNLEAAASTGVSFHPFRPPGEGHVAELYLESIDAAGTPIDWQIELRQSDVNAAEVRLRELNVERDKFLLVLPGSGSPAKNWPLERFVYLCLEISALIQPIAVLGPAEAGLDAAFRSARIATVRDVELGTLAAIAHHSAFIGNDSGVSHLAAASGGRGVVIFGPTDPVRWRPLGDVTIIQRMPLGSLGADEVVNILRPLIVS